MIFFSSQKSAVLLRLSLAVTFLWFGVLKLFNASPALPIIKNALPSILSESQLFFFILSLLEILIGVCFVSNKFVKVAAILMIIHLFIATGLVLVTQGFDPRFPVLSLSGEFVLKNLVLMAAGLVLLTSDQGKKDKTES